MFRNLARSPVVARVSGHAMPRTLTAKGDDMSDLPPTWSMSWLSTRSMVAMMLEAVKSDTASFFRNPSRQKDVMTCVYFVSESGTSFVVIPMYIGQSHPPRYWGAKYALILLTWSPMRFD